MQYRKRMAELKDPSRSAEWNSAYRKLDSLSPIVLWGDVRVGTVKNRTAFIDALEEASMAGFTADELSSFQRILQQDIRLDPDGDQPAEPGDMAATLLAKKRAEDERISEERRASLEAKAKRDAAAAAYANMQSAMPVMAFGRVIGPKPDAQKLRTAIEQARETCVSMQAIREAEDALRVLER